MKQNIGESGWLCFLGQLQKAVDTPEILNCSMNRRMFLILLTVYLVRFLKQDSLCCC